jgi:hypothetical protein
VSCMRMLFRKSGRLRLTLDYIFGKPHSIPHTRPETQRRKETKTKSHQTPSTYNKATSKTSASSPPSSPCTPTISYSEPVSPASWPFCGLACTWSRLYSTIAGSKSPKSPNKYRMGWCCLKAWLKKGGFFKKK